jgi:hypothetical protein
VAHRGLDVDGANVLPSLLQQGDQEVDSHLDVDFKLVLSEVHVTNSDTEAKDLLQLELDGALEFVDLLLHVISVGQEGWEFTSLVQTRSQKSWDLSDYRFRSKEGLIFLG